MGHVHVLDFGQREELLFLLEKLLDEVLVHHFVRWHVELETLREILHEVTLRSELSNQFLSHHPPLFGTNQLLIGYF